MERPTRGRSASRGASRDGGKGKSGGEGQATAKAKPAAYHWCRDFLKDGGCKRGENCQWPHLTSDAVEACKLAMVNLKKGSQDS